MKLAIAILNWNGLGLLKRFLPSLCKCTPETDQIYIIDNCSEDDSVNFIKKNFERIKVIKLNKNYGYAKGYNIGLKNINAEIICLLNNDVEVSKNWTKPIIQQFKKEYPALISKDKNKSRIFNGKNVQKKTEFKFQIIIYMGDCYIRSKRE